MQIRQTKRCRGAAVQKLQMHLPSTPASDEAAEGTANRAASRRRSRPADGIEARETGEGRGRRRPSAPDVKKDQARPSDQEKAAAPKPEPAVAAAPKRGGQIAVFVSKKDGKLYVRQNFAPLFDVPVTIAPSDRPLGTHVFTAQTDKDDANLLHWSVVSLPVLARDAAARRRRKRIAAEKDDRRYRSQTCARARQRQRGAGSPHHSCRCDGANYRSAFDRRLDHRLRSGHQRRGNRRGHGFHRSAAR